MAAEELEEEVSWICDKLLLQMELNKKRKIILNKKEFDKWIQQLYNLSDEIKQKIGPGTANIVEHILRAQESGNVDKLIEFIYTLKEKMNLRRAA